MQEHKPLAFYSRKMNAVQKRYTTGEQELLSIVETLKEFRNILLGQKLVVHTDHMNIVYGNLTNDRIARWRLLLEEFGPEYQHIAGKDNVVADALSRLDAQFSKTPDCPKVDAQVCAHTMAVLVRNEAYAMPKTTKKLAKRLVTQTDLEEDKFPLNPRLIAKEQNNDKWVKEQDSSEFKVHKIEGVELLTYQQKIVIPTSLRGRILAWYHSYLAHPGQTRMEATLRQTLWWPNMRKDVERHVRTCPECQKFKGPRKKYGHLPAKTIEAVKPWNRVDVDMIGPLTVKATNGTFQLRALTMIDPATGWFEVKDVKSPDANSCMEAFDDIWLSRYPRPETIGYDGGSEFKSVFNELRINYGMLRAQSTAYNPQANGIVERVHQVLNNCLRTFEMEERELNETNPWGPFLAAAAYAIRSTVHTTLSASPAQLVFGRDMFLPMKFKADWAAIKERKQQEVNKNNAKENRSRIRHKYKVGDKILLTVPGINSKLSAPRKGPFLIEQIYSNGTLRIRRGVVSERVNIRRVTPFFEDSDN